MSVAPLFIAINQASGADAQDMPDKLKTMLEEAGHSVTLFEIPHGGALADACQPLIAQAKAADGVVVAAGGDGTVNGLAKLCYKHQLPLAIIPLGTFNYFARALGISSQLGEAVATISQGIIREVSAGFVQEHLFLNNASFGLYPKLIKKREAATKRFGRKRIIGALSALRSLFENHRCFTIAYRRAGNTEHHRSHMVFIGNNTLQLETLGLDVSSCTKEDRLAVVILRSVSQWQMARLIWRGIVKNLKFEDRLQQFCADEITLETPENRLEMVIDGEIIHCTSPLTFRVEANAIKVIVPKHEAS